MTLCGTDASGWQNFHTQVCHQCQVDATAPDTYCVQRCGRDCGTIGDTAGGRRPTNVLGLAWPQSMRLEQLPRMLVVDEESRSRWQVLGAVLRESGDRFACLVRGQDTLMKQNVGGFDRGYVVPCTIVCYRSREVGGDVWLDGSVSRSSPCAPTHAIARGPVCVCVCLQPQRGPRGRVSIPPLCSRRCDGV